MTLEEKKAARLTVLRAVYDLTHGISGRYVSLGAIVKKAGLGSVEMKQALQWLIQKRYADNMFEPRDYGITARGSDAFENALAKSSRKAPSKGDASVANDFVSKTMSILFMDAKGWSKLKAAEIHAYVTRVMPKLAEPLKTKGGHLNTWGDALVATFPDAKTAAEAALAIQNVFKTTYDHEGMPKGLSCRIALHTGEVVRIHNPVTEKEDIFGDAVHRTARLEPVTAPGFIFCTKKFAEGLVELDGSAPKAWPLPSLELAKNYGTEEVYVVTAARDHDPRSLLNQPAGLSEPAVPSPPAIEDIDDESALLVLKGWIQKLPAERHGHAIKYTEVDATEELPAGTAKRLLGKAVKGLRRIEDSATRFIIRYDDFGGSSEDEAPSRIDPYGGY